MKRISWMIVFILMCMGVKSFALEQMEATEPIVVAAQSEKVYNKLWMSRLVIDAESVTRDAKMVAWFVMCRDITNELGQVDKELMPNCTPIKIVLDGVFTRASTNMTFALAANNLIIAIKEIGIERGLIVGN